MKKFKAILNQLYRFYENSAVCTAGLKELQDVLDEPQMKLTQAKDVRWLSHDRAVGNLRRCLPAVITSLEREASECRDAQALGLATFLKSHRFVGTLLMLSDVLPPLASLSRAFQRKDLDYSLVKPLVIGVIATLDKMKTTLGQHYCSLQRVVEEDLDAFDISIAMVDTFKAGIYDPFLDALICHIKRRFPDIDLLQVFSIFDVRSWPEVLYDDFGNDHLDTLADNYLPTIVDKEKLQKGWNLFRSCCAAFSPDSLPYRTMGHKK